MSEVNEKDPVVVRAAADAADTETLRETPPSPEVSQQPGFKVLEKEPSRGGAKLVWTAVIVIVVIIAAYYFGLFR